MKNKSLVMYYLLFSVALLSVSGCITIQRVPPPVSDSQRLAGRRQPAFDPTRKDIYQIDEVIGGLLNISHSDLLASTTDQGGLPLVDGSLRGAYTLDRDGYLAFGDASRIRKSCRVGKDGNSIVVSSTVRIAKRNKKGGNNNASPVFEMDGSSSSHRVWSRPGGGSVACNETKDGVNVDFTSPAGTRLDLSFERERSETKVIFDGVRKISPSTSIKAKGLSVLMWDSNDSAGDTKKTYVRRNVIQSKESEYVFSMYDNNNEKHILDVVISLLGDTPIVVKVERDRKTNTVVSKTIVSGQVNSKVQTYGKIITTYKDLKINFADRSCSILSGAATVDLYDSKGGKIKTLTLGPKSSGGGSLKDSSGKDIGVFTLDLCEGEDLMN